MESFCGFGAEPFTMFIEHHAVGYIKCFQEDVVSLLDCYNMSDFYSCKWSNMGIVQ
jgi:hypothetical protein